MDSKIKEYIIDFVLKDKRLTDFAIKYLEPKTEITKDMYIEYIDDICFEFEEKFAEPDIKEVKKFIQNRIRVTRSRLNKTNKFEGSILDYPDINSLKPTRIKSIIDNEILLLIVNAIENIKNTYSEVIERPLSLEGMYSATQKTALYNTEDALKLNKETIYLSDDLYKRPAGTVQPLYYSNKSEMETLFVTQNDKIYYKSKTLDAIDQKIMDYLTEDYKNNMYSPDYSIQISLSKISEIAYNRKSKKCISWVIQRLNKMAAQGFRVFEEESESINDYKIIRLFEIEYYTDKSNIKSCRIDLSSSIKRDMKNKNTIKLYKNKIEQIKDNFTQIFATFLQNQRISYGFNDIYKVNYPYNLIKSYVMLPYSRSKVKNLKAIENSLTELSNINFIVEDFKIKRDSIQITFNKLEYFELKNLKLLDKAKELEVQ